MMDAPTFDAAEAKKKRLEGTFNGLPQETNNMFAGIFSMLYTPLFPPVCRICYAREQKAKEEEGN